MRGARPELRVIGSGDEDGPFQAANLPLEKGCDSEPFPSKNSGPECLSDGSSRQIGDLKTRHDGDSIDPPSALKPDMAAEWRTIVADLRERRLWKDSMAGLVTAYVTAQATALRLEIQIADEGASVAGAGGALKPHPATGLLRSSRETVARLGAELGLTPTARSRKSLAPTVQRSLFDPKDEFDL